MQPLTALAVLFLENTTISITFSKKNRTKN